jgi:hypothetical protein
MMMVKFVRFVGLLVLVLVAWLSLPSYAAAPLPEDHEPYWEYRVIGDRLLLKNPNASAERLPSVCGGDDGLGTTWWDEDVRLTYYDSSNAFLPSVVAEGDYLHIGWADDCRSRLLRVFYRRSTDLGYTWEEDVVLSDTTQEQQHTAPHMALTTSCLHAVWDDFLKPIWEDGHVYYRRSLDDGETWEDVYYLSSYDIQSRPSIAALGDTVYVVFTRTIENPNGPDMPELHFRKSHDEGASWAEDRKIADYGAHMIDGTLVANEDGLHYVFNHDDNFADPNNPYAAVEVFYIHSPDFGETWTDPIIVSHRDSIHSQWPSMCLDDEGTIHVTWFDYKYSPYSWTGDIFYAASSDRSEDDGEIWSEIQVLTDAHTANFSNVVASGNHLYLVWEDMRNGSNNYEVYFRHSPDRGESWQPEERLSNAPKHSYTPVIAEQADTLYVAWEDHRHDPTNRRSELYFKRGGLEAISIKKSPSTECDSYLMCCPNPFNEKAIIQYAIGAAPEPQRVSLKMYNMRGQLVRLLLDSRLMPGKYRVIWDGTNSKETKVSSGVYLCVLRVGHDSRVRRMLFLK